MRVAFVLLYENSVVVEWLKLMQVYVRLEFRAFNIEIQMNEKVKLAVERIEVMSNELLVCLPILPIVKLFYRSNLQLGMQISK